MNNIDMIKSIHSDMVRIGKFFQEHPTSLSEYKKLHPDTSCDKYDVGFNKDDRFSIGVPHKVSFNSYKGYYGNSGCSIILTISNDKLFWQAFDKYLNSHLEDIFDFIRKEFARELREKSEEINSEIERLQKLKSEINLE